MTFRTWAHHDHRVMLRRDEKVIGKEAVPMRDGKWVVRIDAPIRKGSYELILTAKAGGLPARRSLDVKLTEEGRIRDVGPIPNLPDKIPY